MQLTQFISTNRLPTELMGEQQFRRVAGLCAWCGIGVKAGDSELCELCLQNGRQERQTRVEILRIQIPMLPPSVNHYVAHTGDGHHHKTAVAKAWERDFAYFVRGQYLVSESGKFHITLDFTPGPNDKGDVDNRNKMVLDCCAKARMLRNKKGVPVSDAWVKRLTVQIHDSKEDRERGPKTQITIEALA